PPNRQRQSRSLNVDEQRLAVRAEGRARELFALVARQDVFANSKICPCGVRPRTYCCSLRPSSQMISPPFRLTQRLSGVSSTASIDYSKSFQPGANGEWRGAEKSTTV